MADSAAPTISKYILISCNGLTATRKIVNFAVETGGDFRFHFFCNEESVETIHNGLCGFCSHFCGCKIVVSAHIFPFSGVLVGEVDVPRLVAVAYAEADVLCVLVEGVSCVGAGCEYLGVSVGGGIAHICCRRL